MEPQKKNAEPNGGQDANPFGDPHTIPVGWQVSAFYQPSQGDNHSSEFHSHSSQFSATANADDEQTSDTF
jgi:hypothetical protein